MSDRYIIEVNSQPAGIVVRNPEGYRFFAASTPFYRMEGQLFRNAREAERALFALPRRLEAGRLAPLCLPSLRGATRRSNPAFLYAARWIASLRSQ
jgi:hypothetical protein